MTNEEIQTIKAGGPGWITTATLDYLCDEVLRLREDSARLEWLFDVLSLTDIDGDAKAMALAKGVIEKALGRIDTPRAAIDAARKVGP